ncbi:hydroxypyruvate isomerase family protein [Nitrospirillum viridazoti]|uniref:Hydroxypyruvate isomerase n=1 Tax=Nitrospirillum viridazoti CBAmc TaxID=1441467 RepID=A0A248JNT7_9PROT|nr:TIM barrel protein [Nitrospirillum amazonense]ASG20279.1 hydroxypyruvate isomerase [Nitrospirillum amazonense CBAmc]TWB27961.1 hydroxypyruvate isomerase [Nitrospirillum amazonense]
MYLAACIEWLFAAEHPSFPDRIHAAKAAGLKAVEFHLWRDKPLDDVRRALDETGVQLASMVVEPRRSLVDPAQHEEFLAAVRDSLQAAQRTGARALVVASGFTRPEVSRQEQHEAAVGVLKRAAALAEQAGIPLVLEPLNTRVEHPGMFLDSTAEGLDMVEEVGSPNLRLLYDMYHSTVMEEDPAQVLAGRFHLVGHVQVADVPGRHQPGSGSVDWARYIGILRELGYTGAVGLEYKPQGPTLETLATARAALGL